MIEKPWDQRICLVTGGNGFGGSHLCERLLRAGAKVHVFDRSRSRFSYLAISGLYKDVVFTRGDITDYNAVSRLIAQSQCDTVFHLAAQPLVPVSISSPFETLITNALGTYTTLEAAHQAATVERFVLASSAAYYGSTSANRAILESDPAKPTGNLYGASKVAADVAVRAYAQTFHMTTVACRFMNTYGPGDRHFSRLVPRAIRSLIRREPYEFGDRDDGTTELDFLYVEDMANAFMAAADRIELVRGQPVNFGTGRATSVRAITGLVSKLYDGNVREGTFEGSPRTEPLVKFLDTTLAHEALGWHARTELEDGLRATIEWYREHPEIL